MPGDRWDERTARLQVGEQVVPRDLINLPGKPQPILSRADVQALSQARQPEEHLHFHLDSAVAASTARGYAEEVLAVQRLPRRHQGPHRSVALGEGACDLGDESIMTAAGSQGYPPDPKVRNANPWTAAVLGSAPGGWI